MMHDQCRQARLQLFLLLLLLVSFCQPSQAARFQRSYQYKLPLSAVTAGGDLGADFTLFFNSTLDADGAVQLAGRINATDHYVGLGWATASCASVTNTHSTGVFADFVSGFDIGGATTSDMNAVGAAAPDVDTVDEGLVAAFVDRDEPMQELIVEWTKVMSPVPAEDRDILAGSVCLMWAHGGVSSSVMQDHGLFARARGDIDFNNPSAACGTCSSTGCGASCNGGVCNLFTDSCDECPSGRGGAQCASIIDPVPASLMPTQAPVQSKTKLGTHDITIVGTDFLAADPILTPMCRVDGAVAAFTASGLLTASQMICAIPAKFRVGDTSTIEISNDGTTFVAVPGKVTWVAANDNLLLDIPPGLVILIASLGGTVLVCLFSAFVFINVSNARQRLKSQQAYNSRRRAPAGNRGLPIKRADVGVLYKEQDNVVFKDIEDGWASGGSSGSEGDGGGSDDNAAGTTGKKHRRTSRSAGAAAAASAKAASKVGRSKPRAKPGKENKRRGKGSGAAGGDGGGGGGGDDDDDGIADFDPSKMTLEELEAMMTSDGTDDGKKARPRAASTGSAGRAQPRGDGRKRSPSKGSRGSKVAPSATSAGSRGGRGKNQRAGSVAKGSSGAGGRKRTGSRASGGARTGARGTKAAGRSAGSRGTAGRSNGSRASGGSGARGRAASAGSRGSGAGRRSGGKRKGKR